MTKHYPIPVEYSKKVIVKVNHHYSKSDYNGIWFMLELCINHCI